MLAHAVFHPSTGEADAVSSRPAGNTYETLSQKTRQRRTGDVSQPVGCLSTWKMSWFASPAPCKPVKKLSLWGIEAGGAEVPSSSAKSEISTDYVRGKKGLREKHFSQFCY